MPHRLSRRRVLQIAAAGGAGCLLPLPKLRADQAVGGTTPLNRFPRADHEFLVRHVRKAERAATARKNAVSGPEQAAAHVANIREKIKRCFGPLPERTPLNAKITGTLDRDGYRIEKVIYESRPSFLVTANLYVPAGDGPFPAVLGVCGHAGDAKAYETYQSFAQGLAKLGFVCLLIDPIGQGERLQYPTDADAQKSRYGNGVAEHLHGGNQQFLVGEFFGTWRAWDGIRGIDYLLSRPEVDGKHVGVTGNSGGGTMTTWLTGLDDRITMSAPNCFVTTFLRNLENELPADTEQCPPDAILHGLDHDDFLSAIAPKPVIVLAEELDFFDVRGSHTAYERLRHLYAQFGAEENVRLHVGDGGHGYPAPARLAMYQTFCKASGKPVPDAEPPLTIETERDLWCTPQGQVAPLGSRPMSEFTAESAEAPAAERGSPRGGELKAVMLKTLRLADPTNPDKPPHVRILRGQGGRGYPSKQYSCYAVETETGAFAVTYRLADAPLNSVPPPQKTDAVLYVSHLSADAELRSDPFPRRLFAADPKATFYACDVRGIGESRPVVADKDSFFSPYGSDYLHAAYADMLGRPLPAMRTFDLLRVVDWLLSLGHPSVHLAALGWGAVPAAFAAVLHPGVFRVTLKHALSSFQTVAETEAYAWPLSQLVPGVLTAFDLPDCYAELEAKGLVIVEPWGAGDGMR